MYTSSLYKKSHNTVEIWVFFELLLFDGRILTGSAQIIADPDLGDPKLTDLEHWIRAKHRFFGSVINLLVTVRWEMSLGLASGWTAWVQSSGSWSDPAPTQPTFPPSSRGTGRWSLYQFILLFNYTQGFRMSFFSQSVPLVVPSCPILGSAPQRRPSTERKPWGQQKGYRRVDV